MKIFSLYIREFYALNSNTQGASPDTEICRDHNFNIPTGVVSSCRALRTHQVTKAHTNIIYIFYYNYSFYIKWLDTLLIQHMYCVEHA